MAIDYRPRLFTVEEYHRMGEAGVFAPGERVELLDGEIIAVAPMGHRHAAAIERVNRLLLVRLGEDVSVRPQLPVQLSPISEPSPDFALARRRADGYVETGVSAPDVFALLEVSESSLGFDRRKKFHAYARAGVPEYWIVNLVDAIVEIYRAPSDLGYAASAVSGRGASVTFLAFPGEAIAVDDLLV